MKPYMCLMGAALLGLLLPACQVASNDTAVGDAGMAEAIAAGGPVATDDASTKRMFSKQVLKGEGCPLLSAADVAGKAGIAVSAIATNPAMECLYTWDGGKAVLSSVRVHRKVEDAREWYLAVTQDLTETEMQAGIDALNESLDAKAAAGEIREDQAAVGGALANALAGSGADNTDIDGIGDRASRGGDRIKVLFRNVTFDIAAEREDDFDSELSKALAERVLHNIEQRGD